jgi:hypothetical protein
LKIYIVLSGCVREVGGRPSRPFENDLRAISRVLDSFDLNFSPERLLRKSYFKNNPVTASADLLTIAKIFRATGGWPKLTFKCKGFAGS